MGYEEALSAIQIEKSVFYYVEFPSYVDLYSQLTIFAAHFNTF
jgi:hypothetical protein